MMPDKDLEYTYANSPSYESDIQKAIEIVEKQFNREERINKIIKKES
jgi:hypothetical protein